MVCRRSDAVGAIPAIAPTPGRMLARERGASRCRSWPIAVRCWLWTPVRKRGAYVPSSTAFVDRWFARRPRRRRLPARVQPPERASSDGHLRREPALPRIPGLAPRRMTDGQRGPGTSKSVVKEPQHVRDQASRRGRLAAAQPLAQPRLACQQDAECGHDEDGDERDRPHRAVATRPNRDYNRQDHSAEDEPVDDAAQSEPIPHA
jgi:hypothetical protein